MDEEINKPVEIRRTTEFIEGVSKEGDTIINYIAINGVK